jgi:hypothetical protein
MLGPGEYVPDATEGISSAEDLPKPRLEQRSRNYQARRCPRCGCRAGRYTVDSRTLHDLGDIRAGRPIDLVVTFSRHHCRHCDFFFPAGTTDLALPRCQYTRRVQDLAVRLVAEDGLPYRTASWHLWRDHRVFVPWATIQNWVEAAGGKKVDGIWTTYLDEALADFSGYLAIDELYQSPFCVISIVDNRRYNRLAFRVLDHKPTEGDVRALLAEFKGRLDQRGLVVRGITTDGSPLYPKVLKQLWPGVPHQSCRFHILMEITKAVLRAVARLRKGLKATLPKFKRGHPTREEQQLARRFKRRKRRVAELFEHRHLFVKHHLSAAEKKVLKRLLRGQRQLRALREIMDEVYRLFDRRCRTATALRRLEKLRKRVRRFKRLGRALAKLNSPNLEKALWFLDDKLLGSTSNAVERSNRRFRKAQKSVYSVRTKEHVQQRLAVDMNRELRAAKRARTLTTLHRARSDPESGHC